MIPQYHYLALLCIVKLYIVGHTQWSIWLQLVLPEHHWLLWMAFVSPEISQHPWLTLLVELVSDYIQDASGFTYFNFTSVKFSNATTEPFIMSFSRKQVSQWHLQECKWLYCTLVYSVFCMLHNRLSTSLKVAEEWQAYAECSLIFFDIYP